MASYEIRPIRANEWREVRALRLEATRDDDAAIAFTESHDAEAAKPDSFWQERAAGSSAGAGADARARQFVAVADDGTWVGTSVALLENAGDTDFEGETIARTGAHIVGVYLNPAHRGSGVIQQLFDACTAWSIARGHEHVRLYVHADNARAQGAYAKCGFVKTGREVDGGLGRELEMVREA